VFQQFMTYALAHLAVPPTQTAAPDIPTHWH
jgi:hypothetical protein